MNMRLLFIFGAHAAGKMTVGQAVQNITPMKLFHNHMTIEPVIELFGAYNGTVTQRLRQVVFEEFAKTEIPSALAPTFNTVLQRPFHAQSYYLSPNSSTTTC